MKNSIRHSYDRRNTYLHALSNPDTEFGMPKNIQTKLYFVEKELQLTELKNNKSLNEKDVSRVVAFSSESLQVEKISPIAQTLRKRGFLISGLTVIAVIISSALLTMPNLNKNISNIGQVEAPLIYGDKSPNAMDAADKLNGTADQ